MAGIEFELVEAVVEFRVFELILGQIQINVNRSIDNDVLFLAHFLEIGVVPLIQTERVLHVDR